MDAAFDDTVTVLRAGEEYTFPQSGVIEAKQNELDRMLIRIRFDDGTTRVVMWAGPGQIDVTA